MVLLCMGDAQVLPALSLFPHGISPSKACPCGVGFSQSAGLRVVVLLTGKLILKRKEEGAPSPWYIWNWHHIALLPRYSLIKAKSHITERDAGWETLQPPSENTICHKWEGHFSNSGKRWWWLRFGHKKGVDLEYMSRIYENYKALTNASEYLFNWIALYKITWMSVAHHQ